MKKLLLASVFAIASFPGHAADDVPSLQQCRQMLEDQAPETPAEMACIKRYGENAIYKPIAGETPQAREQCEGTILGHTTSEAERQQELRDIEDCVREKTQQAKPQTRVTVAPPYQGPPPIGWVYGPYTICGDPPRCSTGVVNVPAD